MAKRIDTLANIAVILAVVFFGGLMIKDRFFPARPMPSVKIGEKLAPLAGYSWSKHPSTLLLALRTDCHYCEESIPFYRQLAEKEKQNRLNAHLLGILSDDETKTRAYAREHALGFQFRSDSSLSDVKVSATPTLLLVDAMGSVRKAWVGKLSSSGQEEVIKAVSQ